MPHYDTIIVGGGPAGLAAALTLGRACKRALLCDAGTPRNAAATHIHNFVTRDGTPPSQFREIGRAQLAPYSNVEVRDVGVEAIDGARDAFDVTTTSGKVSARRILLCTGMIDEMIDLPGFREAWGHSIFQCPYCHGWEVRGRRWGYLALGPEALQRGFPALLRSWSDDVIVFLGPGVDIPDELRDTLQRSGVRIDPRPVVRLLTEEAALTHVELAGGERVPRSVLFAHPRQRQVEVVKRLDLALDEQGYVETDAMTRQTSTPGIYAAGDLTTRAQGAVLAAAMGVQAASMLNHDLASSLEEDADAPIS